MPVEAANAARYGFEAAAARFAAVTGGITGRLAALAASAAAAAASWKNFCCCSVFISEAGEVLRS